MTDRLEQIDALVDELVAASWKERDAVKERLIALARGLDRSAVTARIEARKEGLGLELRWELDEVLERIAPPPAPKEEPEEAQDDPDRPLTAADLQLVYDDPRGLALHKSRRGDRWFATQRDPRTGQPQTFELHPQEVIQLKQQLAGSPYWLLGAGG